MMNYVGSISIIDRGDAPAQEVIERNTRSLAQRVSNETKEELDKVMTRVGNIYNAYDMSTQSQFDRPHSPNVEYVGDIKELENILTDTVKKKKSEAENANRILERRMKFHVMYQQQVTVFIVGFQNVSSQKMQLLQQVNQFFIENSKPETDEVFPTTPDIDMEDVTKKIEESLSTAESLAKRIGELNQEIINYLVNYANTKASNKGKKRLEKSLQQAKDDITSLSEKLLAMQTETDEKDEKLQQLYKQLDLKTSEAMRYKTAAEAAKKAAQDANEQIQLRDEKINELHQKLNTLEAELSQSNFDKEQSLKKMEDSDTSLTQKLDLVQKELDDKKTSVDDASQSLENQHRDEITEIEKHHRQETDELTKQHEEELFQMKEELEKALEKLATAEHNAQAAADEVDQLRRTLIELQLRETPDHVTSGKSSDDQSTKEDIEGELQPPSRGDSRPSTKDTRSSRKSSTESKAGAKSQPAKSSGKSLLKPEGKSGKVKEYAEVSVQDEGGDPNTAQFQSIEVSRQPVRQSKLQPVKEGDVAEFTDAFDLSDNNAWSNIPQNQVVGRFAQYRRLTQHKIQELEEQVQLMMTKTHRKVNSLKAQFQEHKAKWEAERKVLIEQVEQAQKLQTEAEKEADAAMTQLEEFINEQEKLEEEEENKRTEITKSVSRPGTVPHTPGGIDSAAKKSKTPEAMASVQPTEGTPRGQEDGEQELQNLMQQTDDAKAQEKTSRTSGAMSAPPAVETETQHELLKDNCTNPLHNLDPSFASKSNGVTAQSVPLLSGKCSVTDKFEDQQSLCVYGKAIFGFKQAASKVLTQTHCILTLKEDIHELFSNIKNSTQNINESNLVIHSELPTFVSVPQDEKQLQIRQHLDSVKEQMTKMIDKAIQTEMDMVEKGVLLTHTDRVTEIENDDIMYDISSSSLLAAVSDAVILPSSDHKENMSQSHNGVENDFCKENSSAFDLNLVSYEGDVVISKGQALAEFLENDLQIKKFFCGSCIGVLNENRENLCAACTEILFTLLDGGAQRNAITTQHFAQSRHPSLSSELSISEESQTSQELPVEADSSTSLPAAPSQTATSPSPVKQTPIPSPTKTPVSPPSPEQKPEQEKEKEKEESPAHSVTMSRQSTVPSLVVKSPVTSPTPNHKATQTQAEPISESEEEQRTRSAKSRASLRNQYKTKLDETRGAIEERRAKSPAISIPSQKSLDDDQLILEEDDDDIPVPDDIKEEKKLAREETLDRGTSPPPTAVKGSAHRTKSVNLVDHPVVDEYLSSYEGVVSFRDQISKLLIEKEFLTQGQVVADLEMLSFDRESKVLPQLEAMTQNVYEVLQEIAATMGSILFNDQEPVVSSLAMGVSRDQTRRTMYTREQSMDSQGGGRRSIQRTPSIKQVDKQVQESLQEQYNKLKQQLDEESRKHETQMRHNTVVMMEMQDTINELQRELSTLGKSARRPPSDMASTPGAGQPQAESGVMFTRLDSDRNAKIMKKAVMDQKLDPDKYKEVVNQMDEYVSLPAKRLAHLVRKYVHHCRMKDIEENVKKSKSLNENVFEILDKMEALQNQRAKKWADKMDEMGIERLRLANLLMETLDNIEQESGIFLIKPMYSYRGRDPKPPYAGKLSRPYRPHRVISPSREIPSAYAPAPTPASNIRPVVKHIQQPLEYVGNHHQQLPVRPLEGDLTGVTGSSVNWVGTPPKQTWSFSASHPRIDESLLYGNFNTPRMLELDINRMLIGQNTISARILPDYRLINTSQNLRSYMTVSRPTAPPGHVKSDHSRGYLESRDSPAPPSSPATGSFSAGVGQKRVRLALSDHESPRIPGTPPLPPIGGSKSKSPTKESPGSQSGSSLTQSPSPHREAEIISPVKDAVKHHKDFEHRDAVMRHKDFEHRVGCGWVD